MPDRAARLRVGLSAPDTGSDKTEDPRVRVTVSHLRSLENSARSMRFLPRQPVASVFNGRHASRLRGRGLNFEELRGYLPGDDPRTIDWKVTARTGEPYIRVYSEERDRPALIVVDQRMSMFFGTSHCMKSVTAAEVAAIAAFRIFDQGDRVGGLVFGDQLVAEIKPKAGRKARDRLLSALVRANELLDANAPYCEEPLPLSVPLAKVAKIAQRNHLVLIISDFDGIDEKASGLIGKISRTNDVIAFPVTDPISQEIPNNTRLIASNGELQVELDTSSGENRKRLQDFASGRLKEVLSWQQRYGLPILPVGSGEDTAPQLRRLTGMASN